MSSIFNLLKEKPVNNLSIYFTAGFPELEDTAKVIQELSNAAVDFIEVAIQAGPGGSQEALQNY